jgi:hypothetical protein
VVLVAVFAFSAFITLLAYAPDLQRDFRCRSNVYSKCAIGFAGLAALAREGGAPTLISRTQLPRGAGQGLLIVTPEARDPRDADKRPLDIGGLGFSGPILVVLPKWQALPDPTHPTWGRNLGPVDEAAMPHEGPLDVVTVTRRAGLSRSRLTGADGTDFAGQVLTPGPIDSLQTLSADNWTPLLTDDAGNVVLAEARATPPARLFVLSDPDLLNTQGLANPGTLGAAVAILRTLRVGDGPVIFDVTLDGYKTARSPLKLMFDPPFLGVTLCLVAALALAVLQTLYRFGAVRPAERAIALGKEALTDNSAQLIRLARREPRMAPRYAQLTRNAAARAVAAPRELTGEALTDFLDRLGAQRGAADSLSALAAEAERVTTRAGLAGLAARLYRWRLEMTRERR